MLDEAIIVGVVILVVEIIKKALLRVMTETSVTQVIPLIVLALSAALYAAAAAYFEPSLPLAEAIKIGLMLGAGAGGVYSMGKAAIGKS